MKRWHSLLVVAAWVIAAAGTAYAGEAIVYGQNNPAVDAAHVQAALDDFGYDTITLIGTFDFGQGDGLTEPREGITIWRPGVTLQGDGTAVIRGGGACYYWAYWIVALVVADDVEINDITFRRPMGMTITCTSMGPAPLEGFASRGVHILDAVQAPYAYQDGVIVRAGWWFAGVTGDIVIRGCEFTTSVAPTVPLSPAGFDHAVSMLNAWGGTAQVIVEGNTFAFDYAHPTNTEDTRDYVVQVGTAVGEPDQVISTLITGNAIAGGVALNVFGNRGKVEISDNTIGASSVGIAATTARKHLGYSLTSNRITLAGGVAGIRCEAYMPYTGRVWASNMEVTHNTMLGEAEYGVYVHTEDAGDPTLYIQHADRNLFTGNDLTGLRPSGAYYYFGERTEQNSVPDFSGDCGAVVDYGAHNFISGCEKNRGQAKGKVAAAGVEAASWGEIKSLLK